MAKKFHGEITSFEVVDIDGNPIEDGFILPEDGARKLAEIFAPIVIQGALEDRARARGNT